MVEHAAATDEDSIDKAAQEFEAYFQNMGMKIPINPINVFEDAAREFKVDIDMMKMKIHMYPPSIQVFDDKFFTVPRLVANWPLGLTTMARTISSRRRKQNMLLPTTASWNRATQSKTCMMPLSLPHTMPAAYTTRM
jgi:hypothetical protein